MDTNPLFTLALGLSAPWFVEKTSFDAKAKILELTLDFSRGARFPCPECGQADCAVYDTEEKRWRHLNFFEHQAFITARTPRVECSKCAVRLVKVPWARPNAGFTLLLEAMILEMARNMPILCIGQLLGVDDKRIWRVLKHYVDDAVKRMDCSQVKAVGIDETSARKRHDYVTLFYDLEQRRLLYVADGKEAETVEKFGDFLIYHDGDPDRITEISSDMSPAFIKGAREQLPKAKITFDRFHVAKVLGDALEKIRREEWRNGLAVKGARFALLKRPQRLTKRDKILLQEVYDRCADLGEAHRLKEMFRDLYAQPDWEAGRGFLKAWVAIAIDSGLEHMIKAAKTLQKHRLGILHWFKSRLSNAVMEGLNSLIQAAKRKARGYRSHETFRLVAYLVAGKLDFQMPVL